MISDINVVFNTSLSDDSLSNDTSFASPEEAGPTSLNQTVSSTLICLIDSKSIFDIVYNPDGTFKKVKARLVARDDQLHQLDPNNYAATVESETLRMLPAIVAELDFDYDSLDVKTAFLYPSSSS